MKTSQTQQTTQTTTAGEDVLAALLARAARLSQPRDDRAPRYAGSVAETFEAVR
jgi:hypothetical protein